MPTGSSILKILLVSDKFAPEIGGTCAVAEALASNLPAHVTVAAPKSQSLNPIDDWAAYDRRFPFHVHRVAAFHTELPRHLHPKVRAIFQFAWNALWVRPRSAASLYGLLAKYPVDVVCINTLSCYWVPAMLKRRFPNLKTVFYLHGEEVNPGPARRRIDVLAQTRLREADAVVTVSSYTRDLALQCGVDPAKVTIINNGVDVERFSPGPKDADIEQRFGLRGKKVLLCLARLDERKGQDMLIEAMPTITKVVPNAILLLVGGGDDEARLRSLVQNQNLNQTVLFAGIASDSELTLYYRTADIFTMPNRTTNSGDTEGFGLVFLEAGACAKPVVGGNAGGVPDAIVAGETGYLVNGRSSAEIAEACIKLLTDQNLAESFGRNGLDHSRKNTWAMQSARVLVLCQSLLPDPDVRNTVR
jgi:phosphatidylinositol alpha-1,6-mannosyltransferase